MKRLSFLLAFLMLLLCSCLPVDLEFLNQLIPTESTTQEISAPEETTPAQVHEHAFGEGVITKEPTCGAAGEITATCSCGAVQITEVRAPIAHNYTKNIVKEPTCTEAGQSVSVCSVCGDTQEEPLSAIGHHTYQNGKCTFCGTNTVTLYSLPSVYDADGDGKTDFYNFSPELIEGYENGVHVWAGNYDKDLSSPSGPGEQNGYQHWYVTEYTSGCLVYKVNVPTSGVYEMILHLRLKDDQTRGTKYTVNEGTENEQIFETSYGHGGMDYAQMRNSTHGIYMYGINVGLVAGENIIKIEHTWSCEKSQHYRDFYFVKVGEYQAHIYNNETVIKEVTCSTSGEKVITCSCGASQTVILPATQNHTYVDDICTGCGKVYAAVGITNYAFLYDTPGFAGGTLTFLPETTDVYTFYWADDNGKLKDYTMLCSDEFLANEEAEITIQSFTAIPKGATRLIAVSGDGDVTYTYTIPQSRRFTEEELYTFGALSDTHQGNRYGSTDIPYNHFINAAQTLYEKGAIAIGICGDFSYINLESEYILHANAIKEIYNFAPDMPIFTTTGNHESRPPYPFNEEMYLEYTRDLVDYESDLYYIFSDGNELDYVVELPDGSVMIYLHQLYYDYGKSTSRLLDDHQLKWLEERLEEYKDRTVFLFFHTFMDEQVGDATSSGNEYGLPLISSTVEYKKFDELFKKYTNVVYFSGHSHWAFDSQLVEAKPGKTNDDKNIDNKDGTYATMVHIPACSTPRVLIGSGDGRSEGYIVRVYDDFIVFEGYEFVKGETFAYATYIIQK